MAKKKTQAEQKALLASIVNDTKGSQGYSLVNPDDVKALVDAGHIEVNHQIKDASGKIAARATATLLASHEAGTTAAIDTAPAVTFTLESSVPLPPAAKGGRRDEQYPFSKMDVGQSFFVPVTEKYPKPWETFGSTVSSATRRFATQHPTETKTNRKGVTIPILVATKKFTLRQVTAGKKYENGFVEKADGARVYRTA